MQGSQEARWCIKTTFAQQRQRQRQLYSCTFVCVQFILFYNCYNLLYTYVKVVWNIFAGYKVTWVFLEIVLESYKERKAIYNIGQKG